MKNSVVYVHAGDDRLKGEVLRVQGRRADTQIFEETQGVRAGDGVEITGSMLSAVLGPGLLGMVYDGPKSAEALADGRVFPRGGGDAPDGPGKMNFRPSARWRPPARQTSSEWSRASLHHKIMILFAAGRGGIVSGSGRRIRNDRALHGRPRA
jgi:V/A-type H+-transporting ATPase subunit A